jgi:chromosome segregation ATPase
MYLFLFFCLLPITAEAQNKQLVEPAQADRDQTLRQLLTEVRALRLALERATVSNARFQILIDTVRVQQAEVDLLRHQLETARDQLVRLKAEKTEWAAVMKDREDKLSQTSGDQRQAIEREIREFKRGVESKEAQAQQEQEVVSDLVMRLQTAENRLTELKGQLDLLLKQLNVP